MMLMCDKSVGKCDIMLNRVFHMNKNTELNLHGVLYCKF